MLAFKDAVDAVCWAVLLNMALLRSVSEPQPPPASNPPGWCAFLTASVTPVYQADYRMSLAVTAQYPLVCALASHPPERPRQQIKKY